MPIQHSKRSWRSTLCSSGLVILLVWFTFGQIVRLSNNTLLVRTNYKQMQNNSDIKQHDPDDEVKTRAYEINNCSCLRFGKDIKDLKRTKSSQFEESTCSDFSTQRGKDQRVFSYSVYNPTGQNWRNGTESFRKYLGLMYGRGKYIKEHFPGWVLRIYHNISASDSEASTYICKMYCTLDNVDFCDVNQLPTIGNLSAKTSIGRLWRFSVLGDPLVEIFLSRDTDSYILPREVTAVNEFLDSNWTYHAMRDHPYHKALILAGLWGGWNKESKQLANIRNQMFSRKDNLNRNFDQNLLGEIVYPFVKKRMLQHSSFNCRDYSYGKTVPFSTERDDGLYTGWGPFKTSERQIVLKTRCPVECRPPQHSNWKRC